MYIPIVRDINVRKMIEFTQPPWQNLEQVNMNCYPYKVPINNYIIMLKWVMQLHCIIFTVGVHAFL